MLNYVPDEEELLRQFESNISMDDLYNQGYKTDIYEEQGSQLRNVKTLDEMLKPEVRQMMQENLQQDQQQQKNQQDVPPLIHDLRSLGSSIMNIEWSPITLIIITGLFLLFNNVNFKRSLTQFLPAMMNNVFDYYPYYMSRGFIFAILYTVLFHFGKNVINVA